jgi:hypothetical protein
MGLDMYLYKRTYVKKWEHQSDENSFDVTVKRGGKTYPKIQPERISYIEEQIMYWRKANQIHGWFVDNTSVLEEEVKYSVTKQDLENLLNTCEQVLEILNKSKKKVIQVENGWSSGERTFCDVDVFDCEDEIMDLLPPTQGFFYGSSDINTYYEDTINETVRFLEREIPLCDEYDEFEYYASW